MISDRDTAEHVDTETNVKIHTYKVHVQQVLKLELDREVVVRTVAQVDSIEASAVI